MLVRGGVEHDGRLLRTKHRQESLAIPNVRHTRNDVQRRVLLPEAAASEARAPEGATLIPIREIGEAVSWLRDSV